MAQAGRQLLSSASLRCYIALPMALQKPPWEGQGLQRCVLWAARAAPQLGACLWDRCSFFTAVVRGGGDPYSAGGYARQVYPSMAVTTAEVNSATPGHTSVS